MEKEGDHDVDNDDTDDKAEHFILCCLSWSSSVKQIKIAFGLTTRERWKVIGTFHIPKSKSSFVNVAGKSAIL